ILLLWLWLSGSYRYGLRAGWDLLGILLGVGLAVGIYRFSPFAWIRAVPSGAERWWADVLLVVTMLAAWGGITLVDPLRQSQLPADLARFERIGVAPLLAPEEASRWQHVHIGIALSGGGYRAALFH